MVIFGIEELLETLPTTQADFTVGQRLSSSIFGDPAGASTRVSTNPNSEFPDWHSDTSIERPSHPEDDWWNTHPVVQSLIKGHGDPEYLPSKVQLLQRHYNTSYKIDMPHGQEGVFKSLSHEFPGGTRPNNIKSPAWRREALAWEHAHILGLGDLVPPTVTRDMPGRGVGSYQDWVDDSLPARKFQQSILSTPFDGPKDHARSAAYDYVTGQLDRHLGNWLITPQGKLKLIDNGSAYPETGRTEAQLPHLPTLNGESDILRRAGLPTFAQGSSMFSAPSGPPMTVPKEAAAWAKQEPALLRAMQRHKSSEPEIEQFRERLHHLSRAARDKKNFLELIEGSPFAYMDLKGGSIAPGQDLDMLHQRLAGLSTRRRQ